MTQSSPFTRADTSKQRADDLIAWLRDYAEHHINSRLIDERRTIPPYIVLDFGNRGLLGMHMSPTDGGAGLNHCDTMRVTEQLGAIDPTLATFIFNHNFLGIRPIQKFATESTKAELLPRLTTGRELASFALTEPGAGSNPRALATQALSNGPDSWLLRGSKIWTGSASWAGVINIFARHPETGQISGFAVRRGTPGLRMGPEALTMGMRGMVQNKIHLDDVPVGVDDLLGEAENGMNIAQDAMTYARLMLAASSIGGMKRFAQLMLRYTTRRTVSTGNLFDNPVTLAKFSGLIAATTALQTLMRQIGFLLDGGKSIPNEISAVAKIVGSEFCWQAADTLVQCLGGRGYIETNIAPQFLRDVRALRIYEGPTETLTMLVGASLVNGSEEMYRFFSLCLDVPHITDRLRTTVNELKDAHSLMTQTTPQSPTDQQWLYLLVGEVAIYGTLLAALESILDATEAIEQAIMWTEHHYDRTVSDALSTPLHVSRFLDRTSITNHITSFATTIGDIEQSLADEDQELDELLRRNVDRKTNVLANGEYSTNGIATAVIEPLIANKYIGV